MLTVYYICHSPVLSFVRIKPLWFYCNNNKQYHLYCSPSTFCFYVSFYIFSVTLLFQLYLWSFQLNVFHTYLNRLILHFNSYLLKKNLKLQSFYGYIHNTLRSIQGYRCFWSLQSFQGYDASDPYCPFRDTSGPAQVSLVLSGILLVPPFVSRIPLVPLVLLGILMVHSVLSWIFLVTPFVNRILLVPLVLWSIQSFQGYF